MAITVPRQVVPRSYARILHGNKNESNTAFYNKTDKCLKKMEGKKVVTIKYIQQITSMEVWTYVNQNWIV